MSVPDTYKYLGTLTGAGDIKTPIHQRVQTQLSNLSRAPLHAAQKLHILKQHLIPRFVHCFTFDKITKGTLGNIDKEIRAQARAWMKLPHDTPSSLFHSAVCDGGLGINSLTAWVPLLRKHRIGSAVAEAASKGDIFFLETIFDSNILMDEQRLSGQMTKADLTHMPIIASKHAIAQTLYSKVDGRGLESVGKEGATSRWFGGDNNVSPTDFMRLISVRTASMYNITRATRGKTNAKRQCGAGCTQIESLNHIIQVCPKSHSNRLARHNAIVEKLRQKLSSLGWSCAIEPHIKRDDGRYSVPDLCAWKGPHRMVFDASVVSDVADLQKEHMNKVNKYDQPEVHKWLVDNSSQQPPPQPLGATGGNEVPPQVIGDLARTTITSRSDDDNIIETSSNNISPSNNADEIWRKDDTTFATFICSWRGAVSKSSMETLKSLGKPRALAYLWSEGVMLASHHSWREFRAGTWRKGDS